MRLLLRPVPRASVLGALLAAGAMAGAPPAARRTLGTIERKDPRFDRLVAPGASLEVLADGLTWVEGPVWDGRSVLFSDIPKNVVYRWTEADGLSVFLSPSGYTGKAPFTGREPGSNGLALDGQGRLVLCQHGDRRIVRVEADGRWTTLADRYEGRRLNSPNDLVFRSTGELYFTDPPFGLPGQFDDSAREIPWSGVYRVGTDGRVHLVTRDLDAPNGLAFSPDEKTLYVTNAQPSRTVVMAYDVLPDGSIASPRVFFDATPWVPRGPGLTDGIKTDRAGNVFATGPGGLHVLAPDGTPLGTVWTGIPTANLAWGDDGSALYLTADTALARLRTLTRGR